MPRLATSLNPTDIDELVALARQRGVAVDVGTVRMIADYVRARVDARKARHLCGHCGLEGHNARSCPERIQA